jgi:hypothetical protein
MEIDFKNVVNDIVGVVCRSILLIKLIKKNIVDFTRMDFFQRDQFSNVIGSRICDSSIGPYKIETTNSLICLLQVFL